MSSHGTISIRDVDRLGVVGVLAVRASLLAGREHGASDVGREWE